MSRHVLILEDDAELGAQLVRHLEGAGLAVRWHKDGRRLDAEALRDVELVVLDLMLPSMHGFDVLKHLRASSDVPVSPCLPTSLSKRSVLPSARSAIT